MIDCYREKKYTQVKEIELNKFGFFLFIDKKQLNKIKI